MSDEQADIFEKRIKCDPHEAYKVFRSLILREVLDTLEACKKEHPTAIGLSLAVAQVDALEAKARCDVGSLALRAIAKGGIDIAKAPNVYTSIGADFEPHFFVKLGEEDS